MHRAELETYQQFFNLTLDLLCTANSNLFFEQLNPAWETVLGWTRDELRSRPFITFIHPEDLEKTNQVASQLLDTSCKLVDFENRYLHKDGRWIHLSWVATVRNGVFFASARDITQSVATRTALASSAARLRTIIETAVDAIITFDKLGCIESVNHSASRIFGYQASELIGQNMKILMPSPYRKKDDGYHTKYHTIGERRVVGIGREVSAMHKDGTSFPADLSVSEYVIDGKKMYTGIIRDISGRKRLEKLKNEFISTVSHELRTPLTSIRGSLGLIAHGVTGILSARTQEYVDIALSNSERLVRLINNILDVEKMNSETIELQVQSLDLISVIKKAMVVNEAFVTAYHVKLSLIGDLPEKEMMVMADEDRLIQVLTNLISNAAKFSEERKLVELSVERIGDHIRVSVRDYGPGIPETFRRRIFQRFAQEDSSDTRKRGGTGLGLSISKALIEKMQGNIGFQSTVGSGSTFFFDLPQLPQSTTQDPVRAQRASRVLVKSRTRGSQFHDVIMTSFSRRKHS